MYHSVPNLSVICTFMAFFYHRFLYVLISKKFLSDFFHFSFAFFFIIVDIINPWDSISVPSIVAFIKLHTQLHQCSFSDNHCEFFLLFNRLLRLDNFVFGFRMLSLVKLFIINCGGGLFAFRSMAIIHHRYCVLWSDASLYTTLLLWFSFIISQYLLGIFLNINTHFLNTKYLL